MTSVSTMRVDKAHASRLGNVPRNLGRETDKIGTISSSVVVRNIASTVAETINKDVRQSHGDIRIHERAKGGQIGLRRHPPS